MDKHSLALADARAKQSLRAYALKRKLVLNAKKLRSLQSSAVSRQIKTIERNDIYIVLDNVLDTYNVGAIFRLADAVAAKKVYLCGGTDIPPNPRIKKASINTTEWVEWEYSASAREAISKLKNKNSKLQIVVIEQSTKSIRFDKLEYKLPICLVVGNETYGVSKEVLDMADTIVEIPLFGVNRSLNVMVSLAVVLYQVVEQNL